MMHYQICKILHDVIFLFTCLKRIFGIPFNLLYISSGNPKIYSLDLELMRKLNTGVGQSRLIPVYNRCPFCLVSSVNEEK